MLFAFLSGSGANGIIGISEISFDYSESTELTFAADLDDTGEGAILTATQVKAAFDALEGGSGGGGGFTETSLYKGSSSSSTEFRTLSSALTNFDLVNLESEFTRLGNTETGSFHDFVFRAESLGTGANRYRGFVLE